MLSLYAGKEWLLDYEVGIFWVVIRVLACGGLGVLVWEGMTRQVAKRKSVQNIEVCLWSFLSFSSMRLARVLALGSGQCSGLPLCCCSFSRRLSLRHCTACLRQGPGLFQSIHMHCDPVMQGYPVHALFDIMGWLTREPVFGTFFVNCHVNNVITIVFCFYLGEEIDSSRGCSFALHLI